MARFSIRIKAGKDANTSSIQVSGSALHVITDKERDAFGLGDSAVKNAVAKYFGRAPNDAWLRSPTPFNDLYRTYGWPEVQAVLIAKHTEVREVASQPTILKRTTLRNDTKKHGTFGANVDDVITHTLETSWSETPSVDFPQGVEYSIELEGLGGIGGSTPWSFGQVWGEGGAQSRSQTVGSDQGLCVDLDPGEAVDVELGAFSGVMKARIFYDAYLIGGTAINYNPTYRERHFWLLDLPTVMGSVGISTRKQYTQDIQLAYFCNAEVRLADRARVAIKAIAAPAVPAKSETA
jgi:hypothetical protein